MPTTTGCRGSKPELDSLIKALGANPFVYGDYYYSYAPENPRRHPGIIESRGDLSDQDKAAILWENAATL